MTACLTVNNISKTYTIHTILNNVSFVLNSDERAGLVGANGVGKSTLLKIITGQVEADSGSVMFAPDMQPGYLEQTLSVDALNTLDDMIAASMAKLHQLNDHLRELEQQMTEHDGETLDAIMYDYGETMERFERYGGYEIDYRVDTVLDGLGVGHLPRDRMFKTLSGGEKSRVALALLLLQSPDVLLLDEPTNHLDYHSLTWLEDYLAAYRGAMLVVSHDRHFLNRIVNAVLEIDEHTHGIRRYSGDYDAYIAMKTLERRKWQDDYARQQDEIKALRIEMKDSAHRNSNYRTHTDGDKYIRNDKKANHAQTVSKRIRAAAEKLKRLEANPIPQPPNDLRFHADFETDVFKGHAPIFVSNVIKQYDDRIVLDGISFTLSPGRRVLLAGANGAGKSTLLRLLMGHEQPDAGEINISPAVRVGYLAQENTGLDPAMTLFEAYADQLPDPEQHLVAMLLQSGLFRYDDLGKTVGDLSAGQQRKIQIARFIAQRANLLILDEPTNYISFDVLEELEAALRDFPGPILAASHDRRFIQHFGGELWLLEDGRLNQNVTEYAGVDVV